MIEDMHTRMTSTTWLVMYRVSLVNETLPLNETPYVITTREGDQRIKTLYIDNTYLEPSGATHSS